MSQFARAPSFALRCLKARALFLRENTAAKGSASAGRLSSILSIVLISEQNERTLFHKNFHQKVFKKFRRNISVSK